MRRLKLMLWICAIYVVIVFAGTSLSMYLDSKFYGHARAEEAAAATDDDSQWHYEHWMKRKADLNYRVVYVFPDETKKITRLMVVYDPVLDMYCYTLQNRPYYFKTGLNCHPGWYIRGEHLK
jgi:hypothetical protein